MDETCPLCTGGRGGGRGTARPAVRRLEAPVSVDQRPVRRAPRAVPERRDAAGGAVRSLTAGKGSMQVESGPRREHGGRWGAGDGNIGISTNINININTNIKCDGEQQHHATRGAPSQRGAAGPGAKGAQQRGEHAPDRAEADQQHPAPLRGEGRGVSN